VRSLFAFSPLSTSISIPYSHETGVIFRLYIWTLTPIRHWDNIPGTTNAEKEAFCWATNPGLVYLNGNRWFIVHGFQGIPVIIPGLKKAELLDYYGNLIT